MRALLLRSARLAAAVSAFIALPVTASNQVELQMFAAAKTAVGHCRSGHVEAVPWCGTAVCRDRPVIRQPWAFTERLATVRLTLARDVPWRVAIEGEGCWASPLTIPNVAADETLTAFVWPSAKITGTLERPKGEPTPSRVVATVRAEAVSELATPIAETDVTCDVRQNAFFCTVPAVPADLRIAPEGYVPHYLWAVSAPADAVQRLPPLRLIRGSSISGMVALADRRLGAAGVRLELTPAGFASSRVDERRLASRRHSATANSRGFFQFTGVSDGTYTLVARRDGWSPATRTVVIRGDTETTAGLLMLEPLAQADVIIDPALDPSHGRWTVRLVRATAAGTETAAAGTADVTGRWRAADVEAGEYELDVADSHGATFERTRATITAMMAPLHISLTAVAVRGRVRRGEHPVRAELKWQPENGGGSVVLVTDDFGDFAGFVPAEGKYLVEVAPDEHQTLRRRGVVVHAIDGVARVDLDLPAGILAGRVVDEQGNPTRAALRITGSGRSMTTARTEGDGTFAVIGIDVGSANVEATWKEDSSGIVPVVIGTDDSNPVTLALHRKRQITGWIVTPAGQPVAGAVVNAMNGLMFDEAISGPGGDFTLSVPRGVEMIDLAIVASGYPVKLTRITTAGDANPQFVLHGSGGTLIVKMGNSWPWIAFRDGLMPLSTLLTKTLGTLSTNRRDRGGVEFLLEPGSYMICPTRELSSRCVQQPVRAGSEVAVDATRLFETSRRAALP